MKKLFVVADVHSFYEEMLAALKDKGFDRDDPDHIFCIAWRLIGSWTGTVVVSCFC